MDDSNPDWAPTQHLGHGSDRPVTDVARFKRSKERSKKKERAIAAASVAVQQSPLATETPPENCASPESQPECGMELPVSTSDSESDKSRFATKCGNVACCESSIQFSFVFFFFLQLILICRQI